MNLPLTGIRVADFTWVGAGPFLTKPLADHGADVIKIESRARMDPIRMMAPFKDGVPGPDRSGYFANRNTSKRSVCLDLKDPRGHDLALRLIAESDVVVNNFSPGTLDRLGLGYDDAQRVREDVIFLEMPMMGSSGPYRDSRGYGLTIAAAGGLLGLTGYRDGPPVGTGTNYPDHVPNPLHAAIAVLAALRRRRQTGLGEYIELSQLESTVNAIGPAIVAASQGAPPAPRGNDDDIAAPHGVYPCSGDDEWCAIAVFDDSQWNSLVAVIGDDAFGRDRGLEIGARRLERRQALDALLGAATRRWGAQELADKLTAHGVPASRVMGADALLSDPQLSARDHWQRLDHPEMGRTVYDGIPYRLSRTPGSLRTAAPLLGADSRDVCLNLLDLTESEYDALQHEGVVG